MFANDLVLPLLDQVTDSLCGSMYYREKGEEFRQRITAAAQESKEFSGVLPRLLAIILDPQPHDLTGLTLNSFKTDYHVITYSWHDETTRIIKGVAQLCRENSADLDQWRPFEKAARDLSYAVRNIGIGQPLPEGWDDVPSDEHFDMQFPTLLAVEVALNIARVVLGEADWTIGQAVYGAHYVVYRASIYCRYRGSPTLFANQALEYYAELLLMLLAAAPSTQETCD